MSNKVISIKRFLFKESCAQVRGFCFYIYQGLDHIAKQPVENIYVKLVSNDLICINILNDIKMPISQTRNLNTPVYSYHGYNLHVPNNHQCWVKDYGTLIPRV